MKQFQFVLHQFHIFLSEEFVLCFELLNKVKVHLFTSSRLPEFSDAFIMSSERSIGPVHISWRADLIRIDEMNLLELRLSGQRCVITKPVLIYCSDLIVEQVWTNPNLWGTSVAGTSICAHGPRGTEHPVLLFWMHNLSHHRDGALIVHPRRIFCSYFRP